MLGAREYLYVYVWCQRSLLGQGGLCLGPFVDIEWEGC